MDFYDLKGVLETLCHHLNLSGVGYAPVDDRAPFHPGRAAALRVQGREVGVFGEVHPVVRGRFDLPEQRVCLAEIDLEALLTAAQPERQFRPISRMPALKMDLALVVDNDAEADALEAAIRRAGGDLLVDVVLFDVYRGAQVGAGKKSLAYSLTFQAPDRTLTSEQATKQRDRIVAALEREFGAQIRG
jgi:phenylalanyl-tRNA synthetase beta chain